MSLRRASMDDYEPIMALAAEADELHARLMPGYFKRPTRPARTRAELSRILGALDEIIYVIDGAGAGAAGAGAAGADAADVLGMIHVQLYDTPPGPALVQRRRAHIDNIVVATRHRRHGHGRDLLDAASQWARAKGAEELLLTVWAGNTDAERFYERLGFGRISSVLGRSL
jgi:ribosomal protein S18 acetylase RimI-like enzyme